MNQTAPSNSADILTTSPRRPISKGGDSAWNDIVAQQNTNGVASYALTLHMASYLGDDAELNTVLGWIDTFTTDPNARNALCGKIRAISKSSDAALNIIADEIQNNIKSPWTVRAYYDKNLTQRKFEVEYIQPLASKDDMNIILAYLQSPAGGPAIDPAVKLLDSLPIGQDPAARNVLDLD